MTNPPHLLALLAGSLLMAAAAALGTLGAVDDPLDTRGLRTIRNRTLETLVAAFLFVEMVLQQFFARRKA